MTEKTLHQLPTEWEFWVSKYGESSYEIEPIAPFGTIEDFWHVFLQFPPIDDLKGGGLSLFKKGIRPAWEDPRNEDGQSARLMAFRVNKENWEHLILSVIGGSLEAKVPGIELCGIAAVWRGNINRLQAELWYGKGKLDCQQLGEALNVDPGTICVKHHKRM